MRRSILDAALDVASAEGLAGLSIARLAGVAGMSKSGLFAHFGSKEALQLAAVDHASADFERQVLASNRDEDPGLPRLLALVEAWIGYVEGVPFRGGCFFAAASGEFKSRPGPVRDRLAERSGYFVRALEREARTASRLGELRPDADPAILAFSLHAFVEEANWTRELFGDEAAFARARDAVAQTLRHAVAANRDPTPTDGEDPR